MSCISTALATLSDLPDEVDVTYHDDPVGEHWDKLKRPKGVVIRPALSIRKFCLHCFGGDATAVRECNDPCCQFYPWRFGKKPDREELARLQAMMGEAIRPEERQYRRYPLDLFYKSALQTVKKYCLACVERRRDVVECTDEECWIWPHRLRALKTRPRPG